MELGSQIYFNARKFVTINTATLVKMCCCRTQSKHIVPFQRKKHVTRSMAVSLRMVPKTF